MFNRFLKNKKYKVVLSNIFSLFILQGSNYILPLILLPYLVRVLGVEYFGLLAFATATVNLLRGIVSYGFDLSGTQQISIHRNDLQKLVEIFSSILVVKFLLLIISFLFLCVLLLFVDKLHEHWEVFILTFFLSFGDVLFPIWFFQGIEKMKMITYIRLVYKAIFVFSVILFVHDKSQYALVPILDSIGAVLAGIVALFFVAKNFNISFVFPRYVDIVFQIKNGWYIFISKITVILYTSFNTFILGLLTNNESVGYYSIASKIYGALRGLFYPIIQALFPFLSKKYSEDKNSYYRLVKKLSIIFWILLCIVALFTFIFSKDLVSLVAGKNVIESVHVLHILSLSLVFAIGGFYTPLLVIKSEEKILARVTFFTLIVNLVLVFPSIYWFGYIGLAFQFLIVQVIHALLQLKYNKEVFI
jgi:PST family polysaccharide transporter